MDPAEPAEVPGTAAAFPFGRRFEVGTDLSLSLSPPPTSLPPSPEGVSFAKQK